VPTRTIATAAPTLSVSGNNHALGIESKAKGSVESKAKGSKNRALKNKGNTP
jgi:hypothetical protein